MWFYTMQSNLNGIDLKIANDKLTIEENYGTWFEHWHVYELREIRKMHTTFTLLIIVGSSSFERVNL